MTSLTTRSKNTKKPSKTNRLHVALGLAAALGAGAMISLNQSQAQNVLTVPSTSGPAVASYGFADLVARVKPAVVSIRVKREIGTVSFNSGTGQNNMPSFGNGNPFPEGSPFNDFFKRFQRGPDAGQGNTRKPKHFGMAQGSGFFISADGYVVTNNHVVEKASKIDVVTSTGDVIEAKLIGRDPKTDLALLKVKSDKKFDYVALTDTPARVGDWVMAVGNPFGLGGTVTTGIVSARGRDIGSGPYDDYIQIDAAINRGNSGGPAFNLKGEVIGVNTAIFSPSGGNVGIGFAIPASIVKTVVADLKASGTVTRGWLGVQIQPITKDIAEGLGLKKSGGALVADVFADSPAMSAGFKTGDAVIAMNNKQVKGPKELARMVATLRPHEKITFTIVRDGRKIDRTVEIGKLPGSGKQASLTQAAPEKLKLASLGLSFSTNTKANGKSPQAGVVVSGVDADGPASAKGIKRGDVVLEVSGAKVSSPSDIENRLAKISASGKKTALFLVKSGRGKRFVALPVRKA